MLLTTNTLPPPPDCTFDARAADRAVYFFERHLRHSKGRWAGRPLILENWQREDIIRPLFGWRRRDGSRRFRHAYIELPRKNGKSTLCAGLALYGLAADLEPGAEVYSCAADREQARIVFQQAREMVEASRSLSKRLKPYRNSIVYPKKVSSYKVLSADAPTKHGLNSHMIIFDELHAQPNRELFDVMDTSTGARTQPLMAMITTAGYDQTSICYEQHLYARQVAAGVVQDLSWFAYIAAAGPGDDWKSPATWRAANPGYGVTVSEDYLREQATKAIKSPTFENTFRRLHLNQWTSQETRWLRLADWDACATPLPVLAGRPCFGAIDLASKTDVAALIFAYPPVTAGEPVWLRPYFFVPDHDLEELGDRNRAPYPTWAAQGYLTPTPGNVIDYATIERTIVAISEECMLLRVAFDPWNAAQMAQNLAALGIETVEMRQGYRTMSPASKEFERLLLAGQLGHGGNPVLRWMADNVMIISDSAGNIKPDKAKSRQKIDGIVASVMATDLVNRQQAASVYEERELRTL